MRMMCLAEFARKHGESRSHLRRLIRDGLIGAARIGDRILIDEDQAVKVCREDGTRYLSRAALGARLGLSDWQIGKLISAGVIIPINGSGRAVYDAELVERAINAIMTKGGGARGSGRTKRG